MCYFSMSKKVFVVFLFVRFLFSAVHFTNFSPYGGKGDEIRLTVLLLKLCNVFIRVYYTTLYFYVFFKFSVKKGGA